MDQKLFIPGAIILAGVIVAGAVLYSNLPQSPLLGKEGKGEVVKEGADALKIQKNDFVLGNPAAKVVLIEYGDFQCPFCGRFFQAAEKQIIETYVKTGKAAFVWRDFAFLGEESFRSAEAARCAGEQGKFWEYHDYLFNHQNGENEGAFANANLKRFAGEAGLNQTAFNSCFDSGKYKKAVEDANAEGKSLGVNGTPATFVNGQMISGAQPFSVFQKIIDEELKK
ncbi:MAG: DsbA family protein [Candidatus Giovannonibacteria bacterium]|nr:DsbA family protein [Candidatus Giovannonibacteria bacterium]